MANADSSALLRIRLYAACRNVVMAYIVMDYVVMALYSYGLPSYGPM